MAAPTPSLDEIRAEIDRIDQAVHDLLMRRVEVVRGVGKVKGASAPKWRPAREAQLIRRLVARHRGEMPIGVLVRIWREMVIGGSLALQEAVSVSVAAGDDSRSDCWDLARDHFGSIVPLHATSSARQVVRRVAQGKATIGVVPLPVGNEAWWPALADGKSSGVRVVARLPFASGGNGRSGTGALAIARAAFEPSGNDRTLVAIEAEPGRTASLAAARAAGFSAMSLGALKAKRGLACLLDVEGFVDDDDPRLATLRVDPRVSKVNVIGGYPVPLPKC